MTTKLTRRLSLLIMLLTVGLIAIAQDQVIDYLHVGKNIKFMGKKFELKWCSHPIEPYYLQEWLPRDETFDNYEQMFTVSLAFSEELSVEFAVEAKVRELEERAQTDSCCFYDVYENNGEYMIDFIVSDGAGGVINMVEADIHHYKPVVVDGKKAVQLNFYSRRAYGDDIEPFLKTLKQEKPRWIEELTKMNIVCKMK